MKIYIDVESCGLKGKLLTVQLSVEKKRIQIIRVSKEPEKMQVLFDLLNDKKNVFIGYNIGFDLWKLYQHYKPQKSFACKIIDLYNYVLTGKPFCYYNLAGGKAVAILSKIPRKFSKEIEAKVISELKKILPPFIDVKTKRKTITNRKDLVSLQFFPSCSFKLKSLISKIYKITTETIEDTTFLLPSDLGFKEEKGCPEILPHEEYLYEQLYIANEKMLNDKERAKKALEYASKDIEYLFMLEDFLLKSGNILDENNENNVCVHAVAWTKFYGFTTDMLSVRSIHQELEKEKEEIEKDFSINLQSSKERKEYIQSLSPDFPIIYTGKKHLEIMLKDENFSEEFKEILRKILRYKPLCQRIKQLEIFEKTPGKIYPDFRVIGTSSGRMAGAGGFNFQGVSKDGKIRKILKCSAGGDFWNLEVNIAAFFFKDEELQRDLKNHLDLHVKTACIIDEKFEKIGYEEALKAHKNKEHPSHKEFKKIRNKAKSINFAILYFCQYQKIAEILGIDISEATRIMDEKFFRVYPGLKRTREIFSQRFETADFDTWAKESVSEMHDRIANIFGVYRYITFEKAVARLFWENSNFLASCIPVEFRKKKIIRQELKGIQSIENALRSACLGAASTIQKSCLRSLGNYPIQSSGSTFTKRLMAVLFLRFGCPILNVHDELLLHEDWKSIYPEAKKLTNKAIESFRRYVPTLEFELEEMNTWADKA